jgi:hypothetical protein
MNLYLSLARLGVPDFIKKRKLAELFELTASAFQRELPELKGLSYHEMLNRYAVSSAAWAEAYLPAPEAVKQRLFKEAVVLGQELRRQFRIKSLTEAMEMSRIIYRLLGIDFRGSADGAICIKSCLFSSYYSPSVCRIIAGLDEGLMAGLTGGDRLMFKQRITEGLPECCACLERSGQ